MAIKKTTKFVTLDNHTKKQHDMKKMKLILPLLTLFFVMAACGGNDDPIDRTKPRTWKGQLLNHIVNTTTGNIVAPSLGDFELNYSLSADKATLLLNPTLNAKLDGKQERTFVVPQVKATNSEDKPLVFKFAPIATAGDIANFTGALCPTEQIIRFAYNVGDYRVIATNPDINSVHNNSQLVYSDTTAFNETMVYTCRIDPATMTAKFSIGNYTNIKIARLYPLLIADGAKVEATAQGYSVTASKLKAINPYKQYQDKTYETHPIENLKLDINVADNKFSGTFVLDEATIKVSNGTLLF